LPFLSDTIKENNSPILTLKRQNRRHSYKKSRIVTGSPAGVDGSVPQILARIDPLPDGGA
jgi:hypothetical protein